jgi:hypothetical protein
MKKNLLLLGSVVLFSFSNAQTQLGNSDMESWVNVGANNEEPTNWNSFMTATGGLSGFASKQVERSTAIRPGATGAYCARIWSKSTLGVVANGNLTLGQINMGSSTPTSTSNYNFTKTADANFSEAITTSPDSLVFWAKFTAASGTSMARVNAVLHDSYDLRDPQDANSIPHIVATATLNYATTGGVWVRKSVPFTYSGQSTDPQFILVTFTTNMTPGGGAANDEVLIDDIQLIYNPVNQPVVAADDAITTTQDIAVEVPVSANDQDPENSLNCNSINISVQPSNGTVSVNTASCSVTYTPNAGFFGTDSFTYSICDNGTPALCDEAVVTVTINQAVSGNNPIIANNDNVTTSMNTPVVINVVSNDVDVENQINLASITITTPPTNGTTSINTSTGEITYTPNNGFSGNDSFNYNICDAGTPSFTCDGASVDITVTSNVGISPNELNTIQVGFGDNYLFINGYNDLTSNLTIHASNGALIYSGQIAANIPLSVVNGVYFITIENNVQRVTKRVVKF